MLLCNSYDGLLADRIDANNSSVGLQRSRQMSSMKATLLSSSGDRASGMNEHRTANIRARVFLFTFPAPFSLTQLLRRTRDRGAVMSFTAVLAICLCLSLCVSCYPAEPATQQHAPLSTPPVAFPTVYSPVVLAQLCEEPTSYCIYVDQIRPGAVRASPVNATDDQGAFLFERASYMFHPFHVCYGGCCIDIDFVSKPGCVSMRYFNRKSNETGHLLARFADNVEQILGPRDYMQKELIACPTQDEPALPYAVIGARGGQGKPEQAQQVSHLQTDPTQGKADVQAQPAGAHAAQNGDDGKGKVNHDYFDDVTVPLADLV